VDGVGDVAGGDRDALGIELGGGGRGGVGVCDVGGSTIVVPPLEEVFYRSFLYRYIIKVDFQAVPVGAFHWMAFGVTSVFFGVSHYEWLAGILCGFAYQGLVCWKKRLGDAMTAHAITNLLLGIWVVWKGAWNFW
jgi:CAAX prenyl protease-like protein